MDEKRLAKVLVEALGDAVVAALKRPDVRLALRGLARELTPAVREEPRLLTLKVAAERYGVTIRSLRIWIGAGRLPARKPGKDYLLDPKDVEAAIEDTYVKRPPIARKKRETESERITRQLRAAGIV